MTLRELAANHGIDLSDDQLRQFAAYQALLIEWNQRINLTAITEPDAIDVRHFLDSLTCATVTGDLAGSSLIDVGTGAGFPGLPLKILYPGLRLTLVDSVNKKTRFLEHVVAELGLDLVTVVAERAEALGQDARFREQYDWAVARAVAHMRTLAEYLLPLVRVGGQMLVQKGDSAVSESAEANTALLTLGGDTPTIHTVALGDQLPTHYLVAVRKIKPTPTLFPRRSGTPQKRPL